MEKLELLRLTRPLNVQIANSKISINYNNAFILSILKLLTMGLAYKRPGSEIQDLTEESSSRGLNQLIEDERKAEQEKWTSLKSQSKPIDQLIIPVEFRVQNIYGRPSKAIQFFSSEGNVYLCSYKTSFEVLPTNYSNKIRSIDFLGVCPIRYNDLIRAHILVKKKGSFSEESTDFD